jgi:cytochrome c peroxidase
MTKGTGKPLSDLNSPLVGLRSFNRISAPDANSCAGCHNAPYGISGGGGDFVTNVFVLGQRFDFVTFDAKDNVRTRGALNEQMQPITMQTVGDLRATTGLFGAGYLEMLARQITHDLQMTRDSLKPGESKPLVSKGISFGRIGRGSNGLWDASQVEGLSRASTISNGAHDPPSLIVRPWHQSSNVVSLREFSNTAFNQHHGIQTTERFGIDTDLDGDGVVNEMTRADVTAVSVYQAVLQAPGRVIPNDPAFERAVLLGEKVFSRIGCANCHIPSLPLDKQGWIFTEPNPYNPPGNLRVGETRTLRVDLTSDVLPQPRLKPDSSGVIPVPAFTDFKLHDICEPDDPGAEPLDQNQTTWSPKFREGNRKFLTKRLWGAANEPPFFHHGLFTTMRQSVLAHAGEALASRQAFQAASEDEQNALIEFLKTLQVLPPGTRDLIVDENFRPKRWPPAIH